MVVGSGVDVFGSPLSVLVAPGAVFFCFSGLNCTEFGAYRKYGAVFGEISDCQNVSLSAILAVR